MAVKLSACRPVLFVSQSVRIVTELIRHLRIASNEEMNIQVCEVTIAK